MSAQVVYTFTPYVPKGEELKRLELLQDYITGARHGLENRIRQLPLYWQALEREKFHSYFRSKVTLLN